MALFSNLRTASFRGLPFVVTETPFSVGRRLQVHEYPFKELPWVEDLGRKARRYGFTGFLINSRIYGGGDVYAQRDAMRAACEAAGPGTLIHPSLGSLQVACEDAVFTEKAAMGGVVAVQFTFFEAGQREFPTVTPATQGLTASAASSAKTAAQASHLTRILAAIKQDVAAIQHYVAVVQGFEGKILDAAAQAAGVYKFAVNLPGNFGRWFNGKAFSLLFQATFGVPTTSAPTLASLAAQAANARGAVSTALTTALAADFGGTGDTSAAALQAVVGALAACCADPADGVRIPIALAADPPTDLAATSPAGGATVLTLQNMLVIAAAEASAAYQPWSQQDAASVLQAVSAALETQILASADAGDDAMYAQLRALRAAVVQDLRARGADLAPVRTFDLGEPVPALVAAQRLYRDPTRADQLVQQADPVHPLFLGPIFRALAA
jgi:prophage DNA circulation protein